MAQWRPNKASKEISTGVSLSWVNTPSFIRQGSAFSFFTPNRLKKLWMKSEAQTNTFAPIGGREFSPRCISSGFSKLKDNRISMYPMGCISLVSKDFSLSSKRSFSGNSIPCIFPKNPIWCPSITT